MKVTIEVKFSPRHKVQPGALALFLKNVTQTINEECVSNGMGPFTVYADVDELML